MVRRTGRYLILRSVINPPKVPGIGIGIFFFYCSWRRISFESGVSRYNYRSLYLRNSFGLYIVVGNVTRDVPRPFTHTHRLRNQVSPEAGLPLINTCRAVASCLARQWMWPHGSPTVTHLHTRSLRSAPEPFRQSSHQETPARWYRTGEPPFFLGRRD